MTALRSYSICNHTIGPISGSFFCHLAKSVQADKASWSVFILSVFPVTREALSLTKTATSPSVLTSYHFCKTCLKREIMIAATWRTCSSAWRMQRIELNGEEPAWLTPYLRDPQPEGERDSDWCIAVSYLLITSDDIAIIHYRCHLSGVQWQRRSVAQRGGEPARPPLNPLLHTKSVELHWRNICRLLAVSVIVWYLIVTWRPLGNVIYLWNYVESAGYW